MVLNDFWQTSYGDIDCVVSELNNTSVIPTYPTLTPQHWQSVNRTATDLYQ